MKSALLFLSGFVCGACDVAATPSGEGFEDYLHPGSYANQVFADPSEEIYDPDSVPRFDLWIDEPDRAALAANPRVDVPARLGYRDETLAVTLHLRGEGSFRPLTGKPSFKIKINGQKRGQTLRGLKRLVLKNGVQDDPVIAERLANDLARAMGVPAARANHAVVYLNQKYLGTYTNLEDIDERFLRRQFGDGSGNLYEEGGSDLETKSIDTFTRKTNESDPDRSDLRRLVSALDRSRPETFITDVADVLDLDGFLRFAAFELLVGHEDGYSYKKWWRNNVYLYAHPSTGRFHFIPSGMDNVLRSGVAPELTHPWLDDGVVYLKPDDAQGRVLRKCLDSAACRQRYVFVLGQMMDAFVAAKPLDRAQHQFAQIIDPAQADPRRERTWAFIERRHAELRGYLEGRLPRLVVDLQKSGLFPDR